MDRVRKVFVDGNGTISGEGKGKCRNGSRRKPDVKFV